MAAYPVSCSWCGRPPLDHSLEEARECLERIALRDDEASRRRDVPSDLRGTNSAHDGNCRTPHLSVTIERVNGDVAGRHLRMQRQVGGFSIRAIATATNLSPTRVRQIEEAVRVSPNSTVKYLDGIAEAWRVRAAEAALADPAALAEAGAR